MFGMLIICCQNPHQVSYFQTTSENPLRSRAELYYRYWKFIYSNSASVIIIQTLRLGNVNTDSFTLVFVCFQKNSRDIQLFSVNRYLFKYIYRILSILVLQTFNAALTQSAMNFITNNCITQIGFRHKIFAGKCFCSFGRVQWSYPIYINASIIY